MGMEIIDRQHRYVVDLAEQMMNADTKEGLLKNIMLIYQYVGECFWDDDDLMHKNVYPNYPAHPEAQSVAFDKLIELSYIIHRDRWRKTRVGGFKQNWATQSVINDDRDFESYLKNLKS
ncbi:MAG: hypothetical protein ABL903_17885 [Methylococcales bacterium]